MLIELSEHEIRVAAAACAAVAPSGGGSCPFHLSSKLYAHIYANATTDQFEAFEGEVRAMQLTAMHEIPRALVVAAVSDDNQWDR